MSKVTKTTRVYLTVEVEDPDYLNPSPHDWANHGHKKMDEVRRLLRASGISDLGGVNFEVEAPTVCSFCGYDWEEDGEGCRPGWQRFCWRTRWQPRRKRSHWWERRTDYSASHHGSQKKNGTPESFHAWSETTLEIIRYPLSLFSWQKVQEGRRCCFMKYTEHNRG